MRHQTLRALSIQHELTIQTLDLFNLNYSLDTYLLKMATRLDARLILLWQAPFKGGWVILGSAGLSTFSRGMSSPTIRLEDLEQDPQSCLPYPECQGEHRYFINLQLGPEYSEYGITVCFGSPPADYLKACLKQLSQLLYQMLSHRSLHDTNLINSSRLQTVIGHLQNGVLMENAQREILLVNQAFCNIFGLPVSPHDLVGLNCELASQQSAQDFCDPERFMERVDDILYQGQQVLSEVLDLKDGRHLERDYIPMHAWEELIGHLWVYRDVTEQVRTQREREILSRFPAENPNPVLRIRTSGQIDYANLPAKHLLWFLNCEVGEFLDGEMRQTLDQCLQQGRLLMQEVNFGKRIYQLFWVPVFGQDYLNVYASDITERHLAEEEALQARDEAVRAVAAKNEFLAVMSHEIRTPLNVVLGMMDVLNQTTLDTEQQDYLQSSRQAAENLRMLISQLLDFTRLGAGQMKFESVPFSLLDLLNQTLVVFAIQAKKKSIVLKSVFDPHLPLFFKGDPNRISQVLYILLDNALKFTEQGSVQLSVKPILTTETECELNFCVEDTGPGIAKEKQTLIFESFQQAESFTTRRYGGSGLGLSIARQLIEQFEGHLWVQSEPGQGSQFYFTIRLHKAIAEDCAAHEDSASKIDWNELRSLPGKKVLLADDYLESQKLIKAYLRQVPIDLIFARTGREAIDLWRTEDPDLILMDLQMPEMDGLEAARQILLEMNRPIPLIAFTADTQPETREKCLLAGFRDVLYKPLSQADLHRILAHELTIPLQRQTALAQSSAQLFRFLPDLAVLLPQFLVWRHDELQTLKQLSAKADWEALSRLGHGMKGMGGSFGFDPISQWGKEIESVAETQDTLGLQQIIQAYETYLKQVEPLVLAEIDQNKV